MWKKEKKVKKREDILRETEIMLVLLDKIREKQRKDKASRVKRENKHIHKQKSLRQLRLSQGLRLKRIDGKIVDQYGRILEEFVNSSGLLDLRPVGVTYATH